MNSPHIYTEIGTNYTIYIYNESPRAKTRHLGRKKIFDLDTPLKCDESPLSIPLCGEIR
jgi:hypothetical protein